VAKGYRILNRLIDESDLARESIPGQTIIEIAEDRRVLIENHHGVCEYGREKISVKVKYGLVNICGDHLELRQMTKEQLVISGRIHCVSLVRREEK